MAAETGYSSTMSPNSAMNAKQPVSPEIKTQIDQIVQAHNELRAAIDVMDEKTGYIQLPENDAVPRGTSPGEPPMPTRSPLAHTLACLAAEAYAMTNRIRRITGAMEI